MKNITKNMRLRVKLCPFCGSDSLFHELDMGQGGKWGAVVCSDCGAHGPEVRTNYKVDGYQDWKVKADEEWNARSTGWISVKDRLPEDLQIVHVAHIDGRVLYCRAVPRNRDFVLVDNSHVSLNVVSHWMPMPEAKKERKRSIK